jgi:hypothetical protein
VAVVVLGKHPLPLVAQVAGQEKTRRVSRELQALQVKEIAVAIRLVVMMEEQQVLELVVVEQEARVRQIVLLL